MEWLFDTGSFTPKSNNGDWPIWLIIVVIVSDTVIVLASILIPFFLLYFWRRRRNTIPHSKILICFTSFIFLCGMSHFFDMVLFWWPVHRLSALVLFFTAGTAFITTLYLPPVIIYFLGFKTPGEYKELTETLENELRFERQMSSDIDRVIRMLESRLLRAENEIERKGWMDAQNLNLDEMRLTLEELKGKYAVLPVSPSNGK